MVLSIPGSLRAATLNWCVNQERFVVRLNDLPLVDDFAGLLDPIGSILNVVFLDPGGGQWTWRGMGQSTPKCYFVGVGEVAVSVGGEALALRFGPGGCKLSIGIIKKLWDKPNLFGPHNVVVAEKGHVGRAIWFEHVAESPAPAAELAATASD